MKLTIGDIGIGLSGDIRTVTTLDLKNRDATKIEDLSRYIVHFERDITLLYAEPYYCVYLFYCVYSILRLPSFFYLSPLLQLILLYALFLPTLL